jgi:beta-glucanase (GH16 family)
MEILYFHENHGDILKDFNYKIYIGEEESYVWYFVSEEERNKFK